MEEITYQWQINFAIILSITSLAVSLFRWYIEQKAKKRGKILDAYEKVFDDAIFILLYPMSYKRELANKKQFTHPDPDFEKAVRNFLNSHFMITYSGNLERFIPNNIVNQIDKLKYWEKILKAAEGFKKQIADEQFKLKIPDFSPVNYFDDVEISNKFRNIVQTVGKNLSLFSEGAQKHWSDTLTHNPIEVKTEYQRGLEVCPEYFIHNPRDFPDPYLDLLQTIRDDYRRLTRKRFEGYGWKIGRNLKKIIHPIKTYKLNKKTKVLVSKLSIYKKGKKKKALI